MSRCHAAGPIGRAKFFSTGDCACAIEKATRKMAPLLMALSFEKAAWGLLFWCVVNKFISAFAESGWLGGGR
jgi:hypothetical protein